MKTISYLYELVNLDVQVGFERFPPCNISIIYYFHGSKAAFSKYLSIIHGDIFKVVALFAENSAKLLTLDHFGSFPNPCLI